MKPLVCFANCCFNSCAEQSHKDNVRRAIVEEKLKQKVVQLSEPSSISLFLIFPGLSWGSSAKPLSSWSRLDPQMIVQLFLRVQLTSLLLISSGARKWLSNSSWESSSSPSSWSRLDWEWRVCSRQRWSRGLSSRRMPRSNPSTSCFSYASQARLPVLCVLYRARYAPTCVSTEFRSCVKVEVTVSGFLSLISLRFLWT